MWGLWGRHGEGQGLFMGAIGVRTVSSLLIGMGTRLWGWNEGRYGHHHGVPHAAPAYGVHVDQAWGVTNLRWGAPGGLGRPGVMGQNSFTIGHLYI